MIESTDVGRSVLCDFCNDDYTDSPEQGGLLFCSNALCPKCAAKTLRETRSGPESKFIKATCPPGMSFADWVRDVLRGGKPASITIITGPDAEEAFSLKINRKT